MRVYAVVGAPPEIQAYALAKYSRSAQSLDESIDELSSQRAEQFLNTFYFQYGHRSIADLAHVTLAIENISMLAAFHLVDEPLWDGQGRSSRYQDFRKSGFYYPPELEGSQEWQIYHEALEYLLDRYEFFASALTEVLEQVQAKPDSISVAAYKRSLRARAFDIARYFLPLATLTSNGQVTSARVLEQQISRLTGHPLKELQALGNAIRESCQAPAHNFVEHKLNEAGESIHLTSEQIEELRRALEASGILGISAAPTLVKYTSPTTSSHEMLDAAREKLGPRLAEFIELPDLSTNVRLIEETTDLVDAGINALLYLADRDGRSYDQLRPLLGAMSPEEKERLFLHSIEQRGSHDDWQRLHRLGYTLGFDLLMDFGSLRDLHRHRRCVQLIPDLKLHLGYDDPATIFSLGLTAKGAELAAQQGLVQVFRDAMDQAIATAQSFPVREHAAYLLPLGVRQRALFKMDLAEAAYIIELRSKVGGHFSYRRIAYNMYLQLVRRNPYLSSAIRASNPEEEVDLLSR